jgi:molybdenum cofactor cytidylyltransferase
VGAERAGPVAGVVLAAGTSSRLGRNKLLLDVGGEALVRRCVRLAVAAGLDPVVVVVWHDAGRVAAELAEVPCRPVVNSDYASGQASSLRAGLAALPAGPSGPAAAVVVLADMPLVTPGMIAALVDRYRRSAARLVVSDYGGVSAPPTLYDRSLFPEASAMAGPGLARRLAARHPNATAAVSWPAEALADLDDEGDLDRLRARLAAERESAPAAAVAAGGADAR